MPKDPDNEFDVSEAIEEARQAAIKAAQPAHQTGSDPQLATLVLAPVVRVRLQQHVVTRRIGGRVVRLLPKTAAEATTTIEVEITYSVITGEHNIETIMKQIESGDPRPAAELLN